MTHEDKTRKHAVTLLRLYFGYKTTTGPTDCVYAQARQAYRDGLESMKNTGLIKDYSLNTPTITWTDDHTQTVDVPDPIKM